jgi:hypothetical protein
MGNRNRHECCIKARTQNYDCTLFIVLPINYIYCPYQLVIFKLTNSISDIHINIWSQR